MRRHLSLDAPLPDGHTIHDLVPDSRASMDRDDEASEGSATDDEGNAAAPLALIDAAECARALDTRASAAEAEALELRRASDRAAADAIAMAKAITEAFDAQDLSTLSPQQLEIVRIRIEIVDEGAVPTHHEVARRLGRHPAAVSRQWARVLAKLAAARSRDVSTSAA